MKQIISSLIENTKLWKYHLSLWFIKIIAVWLGYISLYNLLNKSLNHRETFPYLWEKTDFNFLSDWVRNLPDGAFSGVLGGVVVILLIWFVLDAIYDVLIISALQNKKVVDFGKKLWRVFLVRLAFWIPFAVFVGGSAYLTVKLWASAWSLFAILGGAFIGSFIVLFLVKWLDMIKIDVIANDAEKLKEHFSAGTNKTFSGWKQSLLINFVFSLVVVIIVYLTITLNLYFIATGALSLWFLWILRQILVILRQVTRYTITGTWVAIS